MVRRSRNTVGPILDEGDGKLPGGHRTPCEKILESGDVERISKEVMVRHK